MSTECIQRTFDFQPLVSRQVTARFDGGKITSDAGGLLLREIEAKTGLLARLAACFDDFRDPELIDHPVEDLVKQRVFSLALGYEDLNDHDELRRDPLLAVMVGKQDVEGLSRLRRRDQGAPLAGKSTLNRLELTPIRAAAKSRYKKIVARHRALESWFVQAFLDAYSNPPEEIILDLDATDSPLHGQQLGGFFHGYYGHYCYLPLYIFCGEHLLCAKLRPADVDAATGATKQVARLVEAVRQRWPQVRIIVRGDSGFCRDALLRWCEDHDVGYVLGVAKNERLKRILGKALHEAQVAYETTGQSARVFQEFLYKTRQSWRQERRVIGKAEHLPKGSNPRFIVVHLPWKQEEAQVLYETLYCARGEMENRIKEQQLYLFAVRTSCHTMRANQLRLWLSGAAYVLMHRLRERGLANTHLARARCDTIRLKVLKIGAVVRVTVRRVWFSLAEGCPYQEIFAQVFENLRRWHPRPWVLDSS